MRHLVRYLMHRPRLVYFYPWQQSARVRCFVETDFAGCKSTARSTSGGCLLHGRHLLKHWASTQKTIALSSGEAELGGVVRGACEAIGLRSLAADLGEEGLDIDIFTDSSAALGICKRAGIGRVRHLAVSQLWVQEKVKEGDIQIFKWPGPENPADCCTKYLAQAEIAKHMAAIGLETENGRAVSVPRISLIGLGPKWGQRGTKGDKGGQRGTKGDKGGQRGTQGE